ncbi:histidine phosphatase family protein [Peptostreptococcus sp.]|uniref:histidine phosphatase family protein n=1 Tax=Peptostreptococcus sp. TaxID=1262 RepID=UPI00291440E8|nr:histidine phosphatase family protein [Peptostreptococcus sp.]MDU3455882.1 histidine phosphatase family protein [Peptostreptococcus sp.]
MKNLYLVRHGNTVDNINFRYSGFSDCDLSDVGRQQARQLNAYLKNIDIDRIYTSTLKRTGQTVDEVSRYLGLEMLGLDDLREMNFGKFDGKTFEEIKSEYPEDFKRMMTGDVMYTFPDGENIEMAYERNARGIDHIIKECNEVDNVLVCVHMGTIRNILSHLIAKNPSLHWHFKVENASITKIEFIDGFPVMSMMGHIPYDKSLIRPMMEGVD